MNVLIIDDSEERHKQIKKRFLRYKIYGVKTSEEGIKIIRKHKPEVIFLDGDLGEDDCGTKVARFLANHEHDYIVKNVIIISVNPVKAEEMRRLLEFGNISHEVTPFTQF